MKEGKYLSPEWYNKKKSYSCLQLDIATVDWMQITGQTTAAREHINTPKVIFVFGYFTCDLLCNKTPLLDSVCYLLHDLGKGLQIETTFFSNLLVR